MKGIEGKRGMKRFFSWLLTMTFILGLMTGNTVYAEDSETTAGSRLNAQISSFHLTKKGTLENLEEATIGSGFDLRMNWEIPGFVHAGDFFEVGIPEEINLQTAGTLKQFILKSKEGQDIAEATVEASGDGGGTIHVAFLESANDKYDLKGDLYLYAYFNRAKVEENKLYPISVTVNGEGSSSTATEIKVIPNAKVTELLGKWGENVPGDREKVKWVIRINQEGKDLRNVVITDQILTNNGTYLEPSPYPESDQTEQFKLRKVIFGEDASIKSWGEAVDISDKVTLTDNGTAFRLELGDIGTQGYVLYYKSTLENGERSQRNRVRMTADAIEPIERKAVFNIAEAGGGADGKLAGRIKVRKIDAESREPLSGAVFTVRDKDGHSFQLRSGEDGIALSEVLTQGSYKIRETEAPLGYELNSDEYTVAVDPTHSSALTIVDEPKRTSVKIWKKWVGAEGEEVTVYLKKNGVRTAEKLLLNNLNDWKGSFDGLRQYDAGGEEIQYSVEEEPVEGYTASIKGNGRTGFIITNKEIPETPSEIPNEPDKPTPSEIPNKPNKPTPSEIPNEPDKPTPSEIPNKPNKPTPSEIPNEPEKPGKATPSELPGASGGSGGGEGGSWHSVGGDEPNHSTPPQTPDSNILGEGRGLSAPEAENVQQVKAGQRGVSRAVSTEDGSKTWLYLFAMLGSAFLLTVRRKRNRIMERQGK